MFEEKNTSVKAAADITIGNDSTVTINATATNTMVVGKQEANTVATKSLTATTIHAGTINNYIGSDKKESQEPTSDEIIEKIKEFYGSRNIIDDNLTDEPMSIDEGYIRLAMVKEAEQKEKEKEALEQSENKKSAKTFQDRRITSYEDIYGTKNPIELKNLFKPEKEEFFFNSIVLLGRAGIGKTTVCQFLAHHWGKDNLWKGEFDVLIWIPLRNVLNYCDNECFLAGAVFQECLNENLSGKKPFEKKAFEIAFDKINNDPTKKILYVLDGYDEVAHIEQQIKKTPQGNLIRLLLSQKNIILTSRPHYIKQNPFYHPENKNPRRIENIGFLNEDIDKYIHVFFKNDIKEYAETLKNFLNANGNAKGIAHIPINLKLICAAWKTNYDKVKNIKEINLTLTTLYTGLLNDLCGRYLNKYFPKEEIDPSLNPNYTDDKDCLPVLSILKKLAFDKMEEEDLIIERIKIDHLIGNQNISAQITSKHILNFGLLKATEAYKKDSDCYFIHLTFQEFLAACHIADSLKNDIENKEMENFIKKNKYHSRYEIVWWFVAGLLKDNRVALEKFFHIVEDKETKDILGLAHQCF